ncbi:metalloendopeptidase [Aureococcus anophagefferens]|nr:metalloendopeptidase [Aureococcus anophagefferens]
MEETDDAKVRDFWASANDEDAIEAAGLGALDGVLAVCGGDVTKAPRAPRAGVGAVFSVGEGPDDEQSSWTLLQLGQGGLGLPDRDYYRRRQRRSSRSETVAETLGRLGLTRPWAEDRRLREGRGVLLPHAHGDARSQVVYNKYSPPNSAACKGAVDWKRYVELVGVPEARRGGDVNVSAPAAVAASCRLFGELGGRLRGQVLPESRKQRCLDLVERVRAQLEKRLKEVEWMTSEETRRQALEKMNGFGCKIGFPDKWVDYALSIVAGDHLGNVARARRFDHALEMGRVDKETDKTKWEMLPHQINAYYHPNLNEIVFPAAILQPPFFDAEADDATNLGAMGVVVGHEMTHGFDDQGRQYDASGNLRDWWTADDAAEYEKRVQVMVDQAETGRGKPLNGRLTCGENIADLGGLALAFAALEASGAKDAARFHDAFGVGAGDALFRAPDSRVMIW